MPVIDPDFQEWDASLTGFNLHSPSTLNRLLPESSQPSQATTNLFVVCYQRIHPCYHTNDRFVRYRKMSSDTDEDVRFEDAALNIEDDNEGNEGSKWRRLTSKVWDEMEKIQTSHGPKVQCIHCGKKLKDDCGTSHLRCHLNICRKRPPDLALIQSKKSVGKSLKDFKFNQEASRLSFIEFLICGKHPFTLAEERKFRELMHCTNPKFKNLSRHTVRRDLLARHEKEREVVKNELVNSPSRISLTTDNWRSEHTMDEYICITVHWVDSDWKLKKWIMHFRVLKPPFDGISIADEVARCLSEWAIDNKLFSITLDNASYNNVMVNSLKLRLVNNRSLVCDGKLFKIRCCTHILNLIVQAGLSLVKDIISKVRNGVKYLKNSVSRRKKIYEIAENSYHLNPSKRLRTNVILDRIVHI